MQQNSEELDLCCPSFNAFASASTTGPAAVKVAAEAAGEDNDDFEFVTLVATDDGKSQLNFPVFNRHLLLEETKPNDTEFVIPAVSDEPNFPVFNRRLSLSDEYNKQNEAASCLSSKSLLKDDILLDYRNQDSNDVVSSKVQTPLRKLFMEDCNSGLSSSDSESDSGELNGVSPETYCVWVPRSPQSERCKKSSSTGTSSSGSISKKWRLRDLMRRSKSDGKESFVFLREKGKESKNDVVEKKKERVKAKGNAHEAFYVKSRAVKEGEKRKSYLPYRQELVGFFGNANARAMPKIG